MDQFILTGDGTSLCYEDHGEGEAIVFVHGFPFNKSSWQPQLDVLKSEYRVITYDQRGFGRSESGNAALSMSLFAEDLLFLLDALIIPTPVLCGLSMGGYVLMNFARNHPDRFRALVLCDTQCRADDAEGKKGRAASIEKIKKGERAEFEKGFLSKLFASETLAEKQYLVQQIKSLISSASDQTLLKAIQALADRDDSCEAMLEVKKPSLLIVGDEDVITTPQRMKELQELLSGSELKTIPAAGHMSNLEQPERFNQILRDFLKKL